MKYLAAFIAFAASACGASGQITDPLADYKVRFPPATGDKILKWEIDVNGDGKNELFLSTKSDVDRALEDESQGPWPWSVYIAGPAGYTLSDGIERDVPGEVAVGQSVEINPEAAYIGKIDELGGARGMVSLRTATRSEDDDETRAYIYAYVVAGDHFKKVELANYLVTADSAIFTKYLSPLNKTRIKVIELDP